MFKRTKRDPNSPEARWKSLGKDIDSAVLQSKRVTRSGVAVLGGGWFRVSTGFFRDGTLPIEIDPDAIKDIFEIDNLRPATNQIGFVAVNNGGIRMSKREFAVVAGRSTETGFHTHEELGLTIATFTEFDPDRQNAIAIAAGHVASEALWTYVSVKPDDMP